MRKMFFCLLSSCCLSNLLIAHPGQIQMNLYTVRQKEVMAVCATKYLQEHPKSPLTIRNLTADKPNLVRTVSEAIFSLQNLSLHDNEKHLIEILAHPVPDTPPTKASKRQKIVMMPTQVQIEEMDCVVPTKTPPTSPKMKRKVVSPEFVEIASKQVNRLHRQWKSKWNSDGDLQAMLRSSSSDQGLGRKRTSSDSK